MTQHSSEHQQPKEQLCEVCGNSLEFHNNAYLWCKNMHAFRYFPQPDSRPHPAPAYPDRHEAYLEGLRDARLNAETAARKAREDALKPIKDIHERFKHLDVILSKRDPDCPMMMCYVDIWEAVKQSLRSAQQQAGDP